MLRKEEQLELFNLLRVWMVRLKDQRCGRRLPLNLYPQGCTVVVLVDRVKMDLVAGLMDPEAVKRVLVAGPTAMARAATPLPATPLAATAPVAMDPEGIILPLKVEWECPVDKMTHLSQARSHCQKNAMAVATVTLMVVWRPPRMRHRLMSLQINRL
jgi:hypothetical protein